MHSWPVFTQKADLLPDGTSLSAQVAVDGGRPGWIGWKRRGRGASAFARRPLHLGACAIHALRIDYRGCQHRPFRAAPPGRRHSQKLDVLDKEGAVGAVTLPGKTPLAELFRELPFGPDALKSPTDLLNAYVGSEVEISGRVTAKGRVFRVETEEIALPNNGGRSTRHRLTLMTDKGLVQALLEEVTALRFTDPRAGAQLERALAGLTENRAKERRRCRSAFSARARARSRSATWSRRRSGRRPTARAAEGGWQSTPAGLGCRRKSDRRRLEGGRSGARVR